jgi:hypothetical protein
LSGNGQGGPNNHRATVYENTGGFWSVCEIFYFTTLFNGFQIRRFDPFCLVMIRSDRAIITISLQFRVDAHVSRPRGAEHSESTSPRFFRSPNVLIVGPCTMMVGEVSAAKSRESCEDRMQIEAAANITASRFIPASPRQWRSISNVPPVTDENRP